MSLYLSGVGSWNACSIWAHCWGLSLNTLVDNMLDKSAMKYGSANVSKTLVPVLEIESPVQTHSFTHGRMVRLTPAHVKK